MKELNNEEIYIRVTFKIRRTAIPKLIDFLKQHTKTYKYWWEQGKEDEVRQTHQNREESKLGKTL